MVIFRSVESNELDRFSSIGDAETARLYKNYLLTSLEAGETSPDRWFGAIEGDDFVGRIVFWSLPGSSDASLDVFALPWAMDSCAAFALDFLKFATEALREQGVWGVEYEHHEPDADGHTPARLLDTLGAAGFRLSRRTIRFELTPVTTESGPPRVRFRGETDGVTFDDFVRVVARCAASGLDTGVTRRQTSGDVESAAREFVEATQSMRGGTPLWRLADLGRETVGVVFPTANDGGPVLNYIGIVPEHRGRRLVDDLLAEAARLQTQAGAQRIRADSDEDNHSMHAAFRRAGWEEFGRRTTYRLDLNP